MTPNEFAATTILPLMARVVLCLAFLPQGWDNVMDMHEFTGPDAQRLRQMGVLPRGERLTAPPAVHLGAMRGEAEWLALHLQGESLSEAGLGPSPAPTHTPPGAPGAMPQPAPARSGTATTGNATPPAPGTGQGAAPGGVTAQPGAPASSAAPAPARPAPAIPALTPPSDRASPQSPMEQRKLYGLALTADKARLPFPIPLAWAVSAVQLVGGALMLLGCLSRVVSLLMMVIVAGAFVTTTLPYMSSQSASWFFQMTTANYNLVFAQLGLFVLALSVFLVGAGALSVDRALFRRRPGAAPRPLPRHA